MQKLLKPIASMMAIGLFLLFALATGGSTNTTVGVKRCEGKPEFSSHLHVRVAYHYDNAQPIIGAAGTLFIVHQVIEDTVGCKSLIVSQQSIPFTTDGIGWFTYDSPEFTHLYAGDLWRVEVNIPPTASYLGFRKMDVAYYNDISIDFDYYDPPKL